MAAGHSDPTPPLLGQLIGVQTFSENRQQNLYYIDKTHFACQLFRQGKHYLLSRPRRCDKSLFVSTRKALFEGRRDLFQGLAAYHQWAATLPGEVETTVGERLLRLESDCGLQRRYTTPAGRLEDLIVTLHRRSGRRVVLLVDQYDKPITDALDTPAVAKANRDYLRKLYSVIKGCDQHIRFSFLTGVSKFSTVSLFSSLNNLYDLTLDPRYSSICGFTDHRLEA